MNQNAPIKSAFTASRIVFGCFGLIFAGIGITVIGSMWFGEMGEDAPTFAKVFASFISLGFILMGGTFAASSFFASKAAESMIENAQNAKPLAPGSYVCPACGATLTKADVSPLGDTKCTFCGGWFNVHGKK